MAPNELASIIQQLETNIRKGDNKTSSSLLSRAKIALLHQQALIPSSSTPPKVLEQAQYVLELGALISIRHKDPQAFTRYFQQLQPFYNSAPSTSKSQRSKVTGLYLLLLLSLGDYAGFHTQLEGLEVINDASGKGIDQDPYIQYAVRLEQWLMEGSYDRVWSETKSERVPSDEFAIFSDILINTIRNEVASCSERAYASIPVTNAKSLFFLDSEGGVVDFSKQRGWQTTDGRIYFPPPDSTAGENDLLAATGQVIENTLGYARELETIV